MYESYTDKITQLAKHFEYPIQTKIGYTECYVDPTEVILSDPDWKVEWRETSDPKFSMKIKSPEILNIENKIEEVFKQLTDLISEHVSSSCNVI